MFDKNFFGGKVLNLRQEKGVSQQALAQTLGVGKSAISMMESGQRAPSTEILVSLADFFDVSLDYLVGRSEVAERR